eukprot:CCRYP_013058-RA/>CCRYP_013058-RA protein AED:0.34 eAED:0.34 QI:0/-1/0/1/-1/1/1/0/361
MIRWRMLNINGQEVDLVVGSYHIPQASVHLLSPQRLIDQVGGEGLLFVNKVRYTLANGMTLDAQYGSAYLPVLPTSHSSSACSLWSEAFCFKALHATTPSTHWALSTKSLLIPSNSNLPAAQQELLRWHCKLSHVGLSTIHNLTRWRRASALNISSPIPKSSLPCTYNVPHTSSTGLKCLACSFVRAHRRKPSVTPVGSSLAPHSSIKVNHLLPGQCVSCDHYTSPVTGRVVSQSGYSSSHDGYVGGTIYVDHASGWIFIMLSIPSVPLIPSVGSSFSSNRRPTMASTSNTTTPTMVSSSQMSFAHIALHAVRNSLSAALVPITKMALLNAPLVPSVPWLVPTCCMLNSAGQAALRLTFGL